MTIYSESSPPLAIVRLQVDSATSTIPVFLRSLVRETVNALARRRGANVLGRGVGDAEVSAVAGGLGSSVAEPTLRALSAASERRVDHQRLLEMALSFPELVAEAAGEPILVFADEFQHVADLAVYPPFEGGRRRPMEDARLQLLAVVRAQLERPNHVGWVVTGSSVRLFQHMLGQGPLMGRFDVVQVQAFGEADCIELADSLWAEAGADALDPARPRVFRLTQGHPFYADVTCREAANIALRLDQPISAAMVDGAFVAAVLQPQGQIAIACREMYDSLGSRAPGLRGLLDALAVAEPASLAELGQRLGLGSPRALYRYSEDLVWMGILEQVTDTRYAFADPVFRYWVARASDPASAVPATFDPEASRRIARIYEEAYLREREIHGTLTEGYIRDLCGSFAGQQVEGKRLGLPGKHVRLPMVDDVRSAFAFDTEGSVHGKPADVELDLAFGRDEVWLGEVKRTSRRAGVGDVGCWTVRPLSSGRCFAYRLDRPGLSHSPASRETRERQLGPEGSTRPI